MSNPITIARASTALVLFLNLGACVDYETRSDLIVASGGDAVARNRVAHIIDPWPRDSFADRHPTAGSRVGVAMERYRAGIPVATPDGSSSSKTTN